MRVLRACADTYVLFTSYSLCNIIQGVKDFPRPVLCWNIIFIGDYEDIIDFRGWIKYLNCVKVMLTSFVLNFLFQNPLSVIQITQAVVDKFIMLTTQSPEALRSVK